MLSGHIQALVNLEYRKRAALQLIRLRSLYTRDIARLSLAFSKKLLRLHILFEVLCSNTRCVVQTALDARQCKKSIPRLACVYLPFNSYL